MSNSWAMTRKNSILFWAPRHFGFFVFKPSTKFGGGEMRFRSLVFCFMLTISGGIKAALTCAEVTQSSVPIRSQGIFALSWDEIANQLSGIKSWTPIRVQALENGRIKSKLYYFRFLDQNLKVLHLNLPSANEREISLSPENWLEIQSLQHSGQLLLSLLEEDLSRASFRNGKIIKPPRVYVIATDSKTYDLEVQTVLGPQIFTTSGDLIEIDTSKVSSVWFEESLVSRSGHISERKFYPILWIRSDH